MKEIKVWLLTGFALLSGYTIGLESNSKLISSLLLFIVFGICTYTSFQKGLYKDD